MNNTYFGSVIGMRLADILEEDQIIADLKATEKRELLDEMVTHMASTSAGLNRERVLEALLEREKLGSTGIGHGVAIPHGKIKGLDEIKVSFGRSKRGVDFNSMDDMPVHLFFLIVAPEDSAAVHLKVLASISHLLKDPEFRGRLMNASDGTELFDLIIEADRKSGIV